MAPWLMIARRFAPYVAVVLVLILAFQCGAGRAKEKCRKAVLEAQTATSFMERDRDQWKGRHEALTAALDESKERLRVQAEEHDRKVKEMEEAADQARARLASSYSRQLAAARSESEELRQQVIDMEPGLACLTVMQELANALSTE